jgi:hypothetical protein
MARKTILLLVVALSLMLTATHAYAGLGWTLAQFEQQYGKPVLNHEQIAGGIGYVFKGEDYIIVAFFLNRHVSRIIYIRPSGSAFDWVAARALLGANAPDAIWGDAFKNEADNSYQVTGIKDGVETYRASLTDDGKMLGIWTREDDETGTTMPNPDTPPLSSVIGSNEKSTGEVTTGQPTSIDSTALTTQTNHPEVQAKATSRSPVHQPAPSRVIRSTISKVRYRTFVRHRTVGVKERLLALWHQSLARGAKSRTWTGSSNANSGESTNR